MDVLLLTVTSTGRLGSGFSFNVSTKVLKNTDYGVNVSVCLALEYKVR